MKKMVCVFCLAFLMIFPNHKTSAQIPVIEIIKQGVKKVIVAIDLRVQRLQNRTIWLQNAQKTLENQMSKLKLEEIATWVEKQRQLYDDYFQELWKVKSALSSYQRVKEIINSQVKIVKEYKSAWTLFRQDKNFTAEELEYVNEVYHGMLEESLKNIDQLFLVVNAFATQMSDAKRLQIINTVADNVEQNYMDLKEFNSETKMVSIQRSSEKGEIEYIRKFYGL